MSSAGDVEGNAKAEAVVTNGRLVYRRDDLKGDAFFRINVAYGQIKNHNEVKTYVFRTMNISLSFLKKIG